MTTFVKASHLLVKTEEEALKLKEEIAAGKDFAKVAQEVSLCPSGQNGGDFQTHDFRQKDRRSLHRPDGQDNRYDRTLSAGAGDRSVFHQSADELLHTAAAAFRRGKSSRHLRYRCGRHFT